MKVVAIEIVAPDSVASVKSVGSFLKKSTAFRRCSRHVGWSGVGLSSGCSAIALLPAPLRQKKAPRGPWPPASWYCC